MNRKAIIISISSDVLSNKEAALIKKEKPWGIILFKRNITTPLKTINLIRHIRKIIKDKKYPILIDEEGGTVSRLTNFLDNKLYSQKYFGELYLDNPKTAIYLYKNYLFSMMSVLKSLGVNINTTPVLDIKKKNTHKIIGSRSYSSNKLIIKKLSNICLDLYKKNKLGTVIKHIPGHGSSSSDSHFKLPRVSNDLKELLKLDFHCFKKKDSFFAMTAHIIYSKIDSANVSTHSNIIIKKIIRNKIGFKGILISDDISMKALKYDLLTNAKKSLSAGCNLVLYCAGKYKESALLLRSLPKIDNFTIKKTSEFYRFLS
tara:strand:+ start:45 stop:992 length:948 start_codon:yes stop_codon:yes gene_type:complete